jgi:multiple sugar transport system permease protein
MPAVVSGVAVAIVFQWIFNPELGLVNAILSYFGIKLELYSKRPE